MKKQHTKKSCKTCAVCGWAIPGGGFVYKLREREMNYDITFCANKTCPLRANCERNSDRMKDCPYPVWMCNFKPNKNGTCVFYMPMKKEKEK